MVPNKLDKLYADVRYLTAAGSRLASCAVATVSRPTAVLIGR